MAYTRTELLAKYKEIRDAILDDIATNTGDKFRIQSYSIAGRSVSYSSESERTKTLEWVEGRITQLSSTAFKVRFITG